MVVLKFAWCDDIEHSRLFDQLQYIARSCRHVTRVITLVLTLASSLVAGSRRLLNDHPQYFVPKFFPSEVATPEMGELWDRVGSLDTMNVDGCLDRLLGSIFNGSCVVAVSSALVFVLSVVRSHRQESISLLILIVALVVESKDLKSYNSIATPTQNKTMLSIRNAILKEQATLSEDTLSVLHLFMLKGRCCGVVGSSDMRMLRGIAATPEDGPRHPFYTVCDKEALDPRETKGCFVHYFESWMKPLARSMYGVVMLLQLLVFTLVSVANQIPTSRDDALAVMLTDKMPDEPGIVD